MKSITLVILALAIVSTASNLYTEEAAQAARAFEKLRGKPEKPEKPAKPEVSLEEAVKPSEAEADPLDLADTDETVAVDETTDSDALVPEADTLTYNKAALTEVVGKSFVTNDGEEVTYSDIEGVKVLALYVCNLGVPECQSFNEELKDLYARANEDEKLLEIIQIPLDQEVDQLLLEQKAAEEQARLAEEAKMAAAEKKRLAAEAAKLQALLLAQEADESDDADEKDGVDQDDVDTIKLDEVLETDESDDVDAVVEPEVDPLAVPWLRVNDDSERVFALKAYVQAHAQPSLYIFARDGSLASATGYELVTSYGVTAAFLEWKVRVVDVLVDVNENDWKDETEGECEDALVGNGYCDPACAVLPHRDAGDCYHLPNGCKLRKLGNGECNQSCMGAKTKDDYFDCLE